MQCTIFLEVLSRLCCTVLTIAVVCFFCELVTASNISFLSFQYFSSQVCRLCWLMVCSSRAKVPFFQKGARLTAHRLLQNVGTGKTKPTQKLSFGLKKCNRTSHNTFLKCIVELVLDWSKVGPKQWGWVCWLLHFLIKSATHALFVQKVYTVQQNKFFKMDWRCRKYLAVIWIFKQGWLMRCNWITWSFIKIDSISVIQVFICSKVQLIGQ